MEQAFNYDYKALSSGAIHDEISDSEFFSTVDKYNLYVSGNYLN